MANYIPLARTALEPAVPVVGHVTCPCCDAPAELVDFRPLSSETADIAWIQQQKGVLIDFQCDAGHEFAVAYAQDHESGGTSRVVYLACQKADEEVVR